MSFKKSGRAPIITKIPNPQTDPPPESKKADVTPNPDPSKPSKQ